LPTRLFTAFDIIAYLTVEEAAELATSLPLGRGIAEPTGIKKKDLTIRQNFQ